MSRFNIREFSKLRSFAGLNLIEQQSPRIEKSTVKESDFKLPLSLEKVRKEMNRSYHEPSLMESVLKVLEDTGVISSHNTKKHLAWRGLKVSNNSA